MRSFKEEYQREMDRLGTFRPDVSRVYDEIHHRRLKNSRRRRIVISAASAAAVFLLVGGMATAMNYGGSLIRVRDNGFSITSENAQTAEGGMESRDAGQALSPDERSKEAAECSVYEMEVKEYKALEDFQAESAVIVPLPDLQLVGGDTTQQTVHVIDNQVFIRIQDVEERSFTIRQADHRNDTAYAAASSYSGEVANERNYTNAQGYTYKVIDIVDGDKPVSIECAVSLYGRDLMVGFYGYTQEEAYSVLESMDLGVYIEN